MKTRLRITDPMGIAIGALWLLTLSLILTHWIVGESQVTAQAEKQETEFVRVNKSVEAMSYDPRGVRNGAWTETITLMRHRATGACWIGSYIDGGHIVWTSAPPAVCK